MLAQVSALESADLDQILSESKEVKTGVKTDRHGRIMPNTRIIIKSNVLNMDNDDSEG